TAYDINKGTQVVGEFGSPTHAFLSSGRRFTDLGTLGGSTSVARGINDNAVVAGGADTANGARHAFSWSAGVMTDLGTGTGSWSSSDGYAINLKGFVAGKLSSPPVSTTAGFLWNGGI